MAARVAEFCAWHISCADMSKISRVLALIVIAGLASFFFLERDFTVKAQGPAPDNADFYLSPAGNDNWSGTLDAPNAARNDGPFATLDRARRAVQGMKNGRKSAIHVALRGGTYFLEAPVFFGHEDSGAPDAPVIYQAYRGEKPVISGGRQITGWTNVSANVWTAKILSSDYRNFEALFVKDERRYRPRTTDNGYLYIDRPVTVPEESDACTMPAGPPGGGQQGRGMGPGARPFGRFPGRFPGMGLGMRRPVQNHQNGWLCFDRFYYKNNDVAANYHAMALGDVEVLDFEKWTMSRLRLKYVDTNQHIVYTTPAFTPPRQSGGGAGVGGRISGFFPNHRYLIENVKEELKKPGQWYLDRCMNPDCTTSAATWTLTYLAKPGEDPNNSAVVAPQVPQLIVAEDLQYVTFRGLTFSHDNWMPGPEGLGDLQGGFKVPGALSFRNCSHISFDSDVVSHIQGWGIDFMGASSGNQVTDSALYDLGYGAIRIGRRAAPDDSDDSVPQYNTVDNNVIEGGGRIIPSGIGTGVWVGNSHHNTLTHNEIYDFYNGAIRIGFKLNISNGVGNAHDNMVAFNRVWNLGQGVTSDMGGIYFSSSDTKGNQVLNNVIHDVTHDPGPGGYGGNGIYFDQGASNIVAKNNLVYRVSQAGLFINFADMLDGDLPQNNVISNNIFAFSKKWLLQRGGDNQLTFTFTHNIVYWDQGTIQSEPGKWSCYKNCPSRFLLDYNLYWNTRGEKPEFITTEPDQYRNPMRHDFAAWQQLGEDVHSIIANPQFANPEYPQDNFALTPGSPASKVGFVPFNYQLAGRSDPVLNPPPVPPAFPLQLLDPKDY